MSGILSLPSERGHWRLQTRRHANEAARGEGAGRRKTGRVAEDDEALKNAGALRPADETHDLHLSRGITPDKTIIPFCQGGYRSAGTFLAPKSLGYPRVRNHVSSWGEWGNRGDSKIVVPGPTG